MFSNVSVHPESCNVFTPNLVKAAPHNCAQNSVPGACILLQVATVPGTCILLQGACILLQVPG
jgi:hypothetical protein